jgi:predicted acylesterase/phospholipase RssA
VLPGGGARGAYEAGVVEGMRIRAGIEDGAPLPGIDIVVGTSIGAVNGWFVATAQYSRLKQLWQNVSAEHLFQIKPQYRAVATPSSGILTRVLEAALISQGLTSNVTGLLDGSRVLDWLNRNVDPAVPVVVPLLFSATNLELQRSELFFRLPYEIGATTRASATARLQSIFGERIVARELSRAQAHARPRRLDGHPDRVRPRQDRVRGRRPDVHRRRHCR